MTLLRHLPWLGAASAVLLGATFGASLPVNTPAEDGVQVRLVVNQDAVTLRLHVTVDGRPLDQLWDAFYTAIFKFVDRNGDGVIDEREFAHAPPPHRLRMQRSGQWFAAADQPLTFGRLRTPPPDGRLTYAGLRQFYRDAGLDVVQVAWGPSESARPLTQALWKRLDADGNDVLDSAELASARQRLHELDLDGDERITPHELVRGLEGPYPHGVTLAKVFDPRAPSTASVTIIPWLAKTPHCLEATVHLTTANATPLPPQVSSNGLGEAPNTSLVTRGQVVEARGAGWLLTLRPMPNDSPDFAKAAQAARARFASADRDQDHTLNQDELTTASYQFFTSVATLADRNDDGRLEEAELEAYLQVLAKLATCHVQLTVADHGRDLFALLDDHRDGTLTPRALHYAWPRLQPWLRPGETTLAKNRIPSQLHLSVARGQPTLNGPVDVAKAPAWFKQMDRNGDGDVSHAEFLGTPEQFHKLDVDGDGLISPTEARRASAGYNEPTDLPTRP